LVVAVANSAIAGDRGFFFCADYEAG